MINFIVPANHPEQKLRYFLASHAKVSTNLWRKIKWRGHLCINALPVHTADALVRAGDVISYELPQNSSIFPCYRPLSILYEDDWLLIINKPAGMLVHPTSKIHNYNALVNFVVGYYRQSKQQAGCHPVYRLDRNTSGLIIIAKEPQIQYYLTASHDRIRRLYYAIVGGRPSPKNAMIDLSIGRSPTSIIERIVTEDGQAALTEYNIISTVNGYSLLELHLYTGRTHQIRFHMSAIGHPLLGDDLYGGNCTLIKRQALHAHQITFIHPITNKLIDISCPLPADMRVLLQGKLNKTQ